MDTVVDLVAERGSHLMSLLETLLREHSQLYLWNSPGSGVLHTSGNHAYRKLEGEARQIQSRLLEEYSEFADLVGVLLREQPDKARKSHEKWRKTVVGVIEQDGLTWHRSIDEEWAWASKALQGQIDSIRNLYSAANDGSLVIVPDTNALLWCPAIEEWSFDEAPTFEVCLVPVVLSELDGLKVNHRNADVREKAEGLVRRIKGYRDRGSLRDGVPLKQGVSRVRSVAVEPDFSASLSWLDPSHADDRLVATFIEVMRRNPRSSVVLVTRDLNLQNKMEFARLPFMEPPSPE
jgi:hypothetical protein